VEMEQAHPAEWAWAEEKAVWDLAKVGAAALTTWAGEVKDADGVFDEGAAGAGEALGSLEA